MTPPHTRFFSPSAYIPLRRFTAHFVLSALAVTIPRLLGHLAYAHTRLHEAIASLSSIITVTGGVLIHTLRVARNPNRRAFSLDCCYGTTASAFIDTLHMITTFLGRCVSGANPGFTTRQHIAVHFCLVFYVITELEFYRAYTMFETFDTYTDCLKSLPFANFNPRFLYHREPICYMIELPSSWRRYLDGDDEPRSFWAIAFSKSHNVVFTLYLLFHVICWLTNYLLKRIVNPAPEYNFYSAIGNALILFGKYPASFWEVYLGLALLRVVRQADYVGFWAVVGLIAQWNGTTS